MLRLKLSYFNRYLQITMRDDVAGSDIDNTSPPLPHSVTPAAYACKASFSRTQKRKFVRLEFLLFRDSIKICASLFVVYDKYMYCTSM